MLDEIEKAPSVEGGLSGMSSAGCLDNSEIKPPRESTQGKFQAPAGVEITCASMRAQELRECLIREISRTIAIGLQAQAALFDGDDDAALASLFRHWFVLRDDVRPLLLELRDDVRPLLLELRDVLKQGGSP
jgi:hypothetical protein